jgi:hypothetical protein
MSKIATGTFEVKLGPMPTYDTTEGSKLGRFSLDKQFSGDLVAVSKGEMLSAGTNEKGSAGYVAIEYLEGTLDGRLGSFVLQHSGLMDRGKPSLTVTVVPDSGTGDLVGITGQMAIDITGGKHEYRFEYDLS